MGKPLHNTSNTHCVFIKKDYFWGKNKDLGQSEECLKRCNRALI